MSEQIYVKVLTDYYADAEELAQLAQRLRRDLLDTDVEDVQLAQGRSLPVGAKSAGAIDWSTLLITLAGSGGVLVTLIGVLNTWLNRHEGTFIELDLPGRGSITISSNGVSDENLSKMIALLEESNPQEDMPPIDVAVDVADPVEPVEAPTTDAGSENNH